MAKVLKLNEAVLKNIICNAINEAIEEENYNERYAAAIKMFKAIFIENLLKKGITVYSEDGYEEFEVEYDGNDYYFNFEYDIDMDTEHHYEPTTYYHPGYDEYEVNSLDFYIGDTVSVYLEGEENEKYGIEIPEGGELIIPLTQEEQDYINKNLDVDVDPEFVDRYGEAHEYTYDAYMADQYDVLRDNGYYD